jgi:HemY protein
MIRILAFLAVIALAAFGVGWLIDRPGSLVLVWQGWQIETSVPVALLGVVVLTTLVVLFWSLVRFIFNSPDAVSDFLRGRRRKRGLNAVAHGLMAIGIGDGKSARRSAGEARRLIGDEPLTLLLRAQAAQLNGDRPEAEAAFKAMLEQPETRPLGYRGLFVEAKRRGDDREALKLADRALEANPDVPWAGPALLDLQSRTGDWDGALQTVQRNVSNHVTTRAHAKRERAVLLTAKALALAEDKPQDARAVAVEAANLAPSLVPAVALAGRLLAEQGDLTKAKKLLEKGWKAQPHPDIAEVYLYLRSGDAAADRLKRGRILAEKAGRDPEGALALARAALDAREFTVARKALAPLVERGPTRRTCLLMAEIENAEFGDRGRARAWLARAVAAKRDPAWVADGIISDSWQPFSPATGRLDAFEWTVPVESLAAPDSALIDAEVVASEAPIVEHEPVVTPVVQPEPVAQPVVVEAVLEPEPVEPKPAAPEPKPAPRPGLARERKRPVDVVLPPIPSPDDPGPDDQDEVTIRAAGRNVSA